MDNMFKSPPARFGDSFGILVIKPIEIGSLSVNPKIPLGIITIHIKLSEGRCAVSGRH
jgi:hypothetical protein